MHKKTALITGATGGIGYHLTMGYFEAGYRVIAVDAKRHRQLPEAVEFYPADLSDPLEIERVIKLIDGPLHVLVNNAAVSSFVKPLVETTLEDWETVISVNLRAAYLLSQHFVTANKGETYGRIINIASTRFHQNEAGWDLYGISKGGLVSMTHSLCVSLRETPITVNTISPGWIETQHYEALSPEDHAQHPSGRVGKPRDIVNACLFFSAPENDFINGANLVVDGGMTKRMLYL